MSNPNMRLMARMIKDAERFYKDGDDTVLWKNDFMSGTDITLMSMMIKDAERFYQDGDDNMLWKDYIGEDGLPTTSKEVNDEYLYNREKEDDEDDEYWRFFDHDIWGYDDSAYRGETVGYFFYRNPHRVSVPTCFKVERHPDDDLLLEQLLEAQVPLSEHHGCHNHGIEYLIKDAVIIIIWQGSKCRREWKELRDLSPAASNNRLFADGIKACVYLVHLLYTKDSLYKIARRHTLSKQLKELWEKIEVLHKNDRPTHEVCKLIVQLMTDKEKYSFVTEFNLAKMVDSYYSSKLLDMELMEVSVEEFQYPSIYEVDAPGKDESGIFNDITKVVMEMESPPTMLKVDDYICFLKKLIREDGEEMIDPIWEALKMVTDTKTLHNLVNLNEIIHDEVQMLLYSVLNNTTRKLKSQLSCITDPFFELDDIYSHCVSTKIFDIVEVAELRRIALGSRFIGRSHLIWALYERGYGLPPEVRNMIEVNSTDEDHPPYHIYMASISLAKLLGEDETRLEHFVFVVLHSKYIGFDGEKVVDMLRDFKGFREALERFEVERSRDAEKGITIVDHPDRMDHVTEYSN